VEKNLSKVIAGLRSEDVKQWTPPTVAAKGGGEGGLGRGALMTAEQLEQIQKQAYDEGFEQGKREGFEYGHKEALGEGREIMQGRIERMDALMAALDEPLKQLDDDVENELIDLVIAMVRQLVRREVKTDPGQIVGVVREALNILPVSARNVRLVLHPEDADLIRNIYGLSEAELGWSIMEDPVIERGGCKVLTDISQVDATLESRLTALIAPLLGGERDIDEESAEDL
jgi:flagellar assembly protein FliH